MLKTKNNGWSFINSLVILIGILPAVADNSLFQITGTSSMDVLFPDPSVYSRILHWIMIAILPVGLFYVVTKKNLWMLFGLLPHISGLLLEIVSSTGIVNVQLFSILLFVSYKIAFVYFIIAHHIRSFPYLIAFILMGILLSPLQVILFLIFSVLSRLIYLVITQNLEIFLISNVRN